MYTISKETEQQAIEKIYESLLVLQNAHYSIEIINKSLLEDSTCSTKEIISLLSEETKLINLEIKILKNVLEKN